MGSLMGSLRLIALSASLLALAGAWLLAMPAVSALEDCVNDYADLPLGPARPESVVAFRAAADETGLLQDITLSWANKADNANCVSADFRLSPGPVTGGEGQWELLTSIRDPLVTQYEHFDLASTGHVCYRVYSSNEYGRSSFSNRVCLVLEGFNFPEVPGEVDEEPDSTFQLWYVLVAALGGAIVLAVAVIVLRRRRAPSSSAQE